MKPYPDYRDSGVPWLGSLPAQWDVRRNGRLFAQRVETGFPELPILEVSLKTGVRVRDMDNLKRKQVMSERGKYKRAVKGDIAYNMMRMWQGAVGVAPVDGLVSPAYVVARPFAGTDSRYFSYLFRTSAYMTEVDGYSRGIVKDRNRLYWEDFKRMPTCVPPLDEQRRIADYLDAHGRLVQRFIRNRRRLIGVLNEQKQAIIDRLVTRGLDPSVRLKPSGIDWLGEVPAHWEVRRLKTVGTVIMGQSPPSSECNGDGQGLPFLQGSAEFGAHHPRAIQYCPTASKISPEGAILFSVRAPVGAMNVADQEYGIGRGLCAIVPDTTALERGYAMHAISSGKVQLLMIATGSTYDAVSAGEVGAMQLPLPPIAEQQAIAQRIWDATLDLSTAIEQVQREIELMREYRTRLVSDVVTGKFDVRGLTTPVGRLDEPQDEEEELCENTGEDADSNDEASEPVEEAAAD